MGGKTFNHMEFLIWVFILCAFICLVLFFMSFGAITNTRAERYRSLAVKFGIVGVVDALIIALLLA